ncbi:hypothetical protein C2G38_2212522 [Gigaspora rosea]|uniref:Uncharacterized protein n=1 Tax=Gigaspora rosea TaxID=44941 RepID=A0A397UG96_9GLOM|nr:hypothetical protein C2G38_2212522 [Gigaspora rosea]
MTQEPEQKKKGQRYLNLDEKENRRTIGIIGRKRSEAQVSIDKIKDKHQYEYWKRNDYKEKKSDTDLSDEVRHILSFGDEETNAKNSVIGSAVKEAETGREILTI